MTAPALPRRRFALLLASSAALVAVAPASALGGDWNWGDGGRRTEGNGRIKTETRKVAGFHGISYSLPGTVEVRTGGAESLSIETDENLLPLIETVVEDGILKIRTARRNGGISTRHLRLVITARSLDNLALGGSGDLNVDALRGPRASVSLGGSGNVNVRQVEAESLSVDLGGSGDIKLAAGRSASLAVAIAGSGDIDMGQVQSRNAKVSIAGSGEATIAVSDQLDVSIIGSGDVTYYGNPRVSKSVMGSGSITQK